MTEQPKIDVTEIAYHRNGISGEGFHAVRFVHRVDGPRSKPQEFLATVFPAKGHVSVISLDLISSAGVAFGLNSWRGDTFERSLRRAIKKHDAR